MPGRALAVFRQPMMARGKRSRSSRSPGPRRNRWRSSRHPRADAGPGCSCRCFHCAGAPSWGSATSPTCPVSPPGPGEPGCRWCRCCRSTRHRRSTRAPTPPSAPLPSIRCSWASTPARTGRGPAGGRAYRRSCVGSWRRWPRAPTSTGRACASSSAWPPGAPSSASCATSGRARADGPSNWHPS